MQSAAGKVRFPRAAALAVAAELCRALKPTCEPGRLIVAGSLRRRRADVGDVEIVYVPRIEERPDPADFFARRQVNLADEVLDGLRRRGVIAPRTGPAGGTAWGAQNKFAVHLASGIPVDLFSTTAAAWFNYLVCRTGPAESNMRIASEANARGWHWHPCGAGFSLRGHLEPMSSERAVFDFVGLPYLEPWQR